MLLRERTDRVVIVWTLGIGSVARCTIDVSERTTARPPHDELLRLTA